MQKNRLRLNFALETTEERLRFVEEYLPTIDFSLNEHESETLSDYLLWGKNDTGLNSQQEGDVVLKEWAASKVDSIESLMEAPGFQETKLKRLGETHYHTPRVVFDRAEALAKAPEHLRPVLEELFGHIDYIELIINYYDLQHGKRKTPPRDSLLNSFSEEKRKLCERRASYLNQRQYLQMRHRLVELRTEQYTYKDYISSSIMPRIDNSVQEENRVQFGVDIQVLPFGLFGNSDFCKKIFSENLAPGQFTEEELIKISEMIWEKKESKNYLDFENPEHILSLYRTYDDLKFEAEEDPDQIYGAAAPILRTLEYYTNQAKLNDLQREILWMKISKSSNLSIAEHINQKYETTYNDNYISTIYRKKVLPAIAEAATYHRLILENIFYPEAFKKCKDCGRVLLRSPEFFMRQHKAPDGFSPRCKVCQKLKREQEKNKK